VPKTKTQPIPNPHENTNRDEAVAEHMQEPLSGSKKVKNRNHSRQKQHSEG
jgi:small acid-soluble spore protein P (minor)